MKFLYRRETMSKFCYWILTDGTIVQPEQRHILAVAQAPTAFGETIESMEKTFAPYGQDIHSNFEGKPREETLKRVICRNHIRIRKNRLKRGQHWSVQLYTLNNERKAAIAAWARHIIPATDDKYGDVIIHQFQDGSKIRTSLDQLADGFDNKGKPAIITQAELVRRYK
jgi:hypothetical protein